jgi:hypothetical protein
MADLGIKRLYRFLVYLGGKHCQQRLNPPRLNKEDPFALSASRNAFSLEKNLVLV